MDKLLKAHNLLRWNWKKKWDCEQANSKFQNWISNKKSCHPIKATDQINSQSNSSRCTKRHGTNPMEYLVKSQGEGTAS